MLRSLLVVLLLLSGQGMALASVTAGGATENEAEVVVAAVLTCDQAGFLHLVDPRRGSSWEQGRVMVSSGDGPAYGPVLTDLARDPVTGDVYGISFDTLYWVDPMDPASSRVLVRLDRASLNGLTAMSDGRLLASSLDGELVQIDPTTGTTKELARFPGDLVSSGDLALHHGGLYGAGSGPDGDILVRFDPVAGRAEAIGPLVSGDGVRYQVWGLVHLDAELVALSYEGQAFTVDPESGWMTPLGPSPMGLYGATRIEITE